MAKFSIDRRRFAIGAAAAATTAIISPAEALEEAQAQTTRLPSRRPRTKRRGSPWRSFRLRRRPKWKPK